MKLSHINELRELCNITHRRLLKVRSIENIISKPGFAKVWDKSSDEDKSLVVLLVSANDKIGVNKWYNKHKSLALADRSLNQLKDIAQKLRIPNYSRLSKLEIVSIIKRRFPDYDKA